MATHTTVVARTPSSKNKDGAAPAAVCVISGDSAEGLARSISEKLGARMVQTEIRVFADGESKLKLEGKIAAGTASVIVVQSLHPPVDTNLLRALCLISKAREEVPGCAITAVIPYMGYARQDSEFLPGEITTIRVVGGLLRGAGASRIVTVDMHSEKGLKMLGPGASNVTAIPALARRFGSMRLRNPIVVSPDKGGAKRAEQFASVMGYGLLVLEKSRDRKTGAVRIRTRRASAVKDRDVILVDDMISTGGSIARAAEFLRGQGSGRVYAACTHALLVDGARAKMRKAGVAKIVSANTIPSNRSGAVADVSEEIARELAA